MKIVHVQNKIRLFRQICTHTNDILICEKRRNFASSLLLSSKRSFCTIQVEQDVNRPSTCSCDVTNMSRWRGPLHGHRFLNRAWNFINSNNNVSRKLVNVVYIFNIECILLQIQIIFVSTHQEPAQFSKVLASVLSNEIKILTGISDLYTVN